MLALRPLRTTTAALTHRTLTTTTRLQTNPPPSNQSPSAKQASRSTQPASDPQSSASLKQPDANAQGDDHPAKQPDTQKASERSTGFGNVEEVKGGKEGLGARTDKNPDATKGKA
ncbi:hypothetical protein LTR62_000041 [Meristemomyces frigidus]|uniref:Uncharacterized protein n=1 Tax=Meristemomyces frigidus TaxID=1508187 RepID=A0AAN7TQ57_9PEZI|nr:hypothetical protein LTR62_000041 [Meristemomyces frigidus]